MTVPTSRLIGELFRIHNGKADTLPDVDALRELLDNSDAQRDSELLNELLYLAAVTMSVPLEMREYAVEQLLDAAHKEMRERVKR